MPTMSGVQAYQSVVERLAPQARNAGASKGALKLIEDRLAPLRRVGDGELKSIQGEFAQDARHRLGEMADGRVPTDGRSVETARSTILAADFLYARFGGTPVRTRDSITELMRLQSAAGAREVPAAARPAAAETETISVSGLTLRVAPAAEARVPLDGTAEVVAGRFQPGGDLSGTPYLSLRTAGRILQDERGSAQVFAPDGTGRIALSLVARRVGLDEKRASAAFDIAAEALNRSRPAVDAAARAAAVQARIASLATVARPVARPPAAVGLER